jgi:hypothetical protein
VTLNPESAVAKDVTIYYSFHNQLGVAGLQTAKPMPSGFFDSQAKLMKISNTKFISKLTHSFKIICKSDTGGSCP